MAQKKKKQNNNAQQKVMLAQLRKEHIRKLRNIFVLLDDLPLYSLLSEKAIEKLYFFRAAPIKAVAVVGHTIPKEVIEFLTNGIKSLLNDTSITLYKEGPQISFADYYYIGVTLDLFLMNDAPFLTECSKNFSLDKAGPYTRQYIDSIDERNLHFEESVNETLDFITILYCNLSGKIYFASRNSDFFYEKGNKDFRRHTIIEVKSFVAPRRQFTVDGNTRPAIRLCWKTNSYHKNIDLTVEQLGLQGQYAPETTFEVYVQQHALNRLAERIDSSYPGIIQFDMFASFLILKVTRDHRGDFLIEFNMLGLKAGYFKASIIDGAVLLRTFLFLTNNGTPEGRRLEKMTGLKMLDKKYLDIDKLSVLIHSDIPANGEAAEIFRKAGCGSLLKLCSKLKDSLLWENPGQNIEVAVRLLEYMRKGREETAAIDFADFDGMGDEASH